MTCRRPDRAFQVDVLVVGLGPAGASSARVAAQQGCSVIAIDKKTVPGVPVQCAEFVPQALRRFGIDRHAIVQPIQAMRSRLPSGKVNTVNSAGFMLHRARYEASLVDRAKQKGARILNGAVLQKLDVAERVVLIKSSGREYSVRYSLLIAADGARSKVARLAQWAPLQTLRAQQYTLRLNTPLNHLEVRLSPYYPGGYAWLFPKGDVAHVGVGFVTQKADELKQKLLGFIRILVGEKLVFNRVESRTGGDIPVSGLRDELVHDHILLAGDAAGLTHPITGAGIASAVISGEQAGICAADYLHGAGSQALVEYEHYLRDVYQPVLSRALQRRAQLQQSIQAGRDLSETQLRQCWSGFPDYYQ